MAPVYVPGAAVCNRTFVRSNGWPGPRLSLLLLLLRLDSRFYSPTSTAQEPPNPPERKALTELAVVDAAFDVVASASVIFDDSDEL